MIPPAGTHSGVASLLEQRRSARKPAFVEGATGRSISWDGLCEVAAGWRRSTDLGGGGPVGTMVSDPLEMVATYLAALSGGVALAPLNPRATAGEVATAICTLGLSAVVSDDPSAPVAAAVRSAGAELWSTRSGVLAREGRGRERRVMAPGARSASKDEAAVILSSSGTTGTPKIIPLSEAHLLHTARSVASHHQLAAADCGYCPLPLFHINALVVGALSALVAGSTLVVDRRFSAGSFWDVVDRHRVTWLNLVPAIIAVLSARHAPDPSVASRVRFARSASAPLPLATLERFEAAAGIPVIETYGMTEAASQITANDIPSAGRRLGSVGRPVGVDLRVVDKGGRTVAAGALGQVEIRGPSVIECYQAPAGSPAPPRPARAAGGWLATGDLGHLDRDGYVYLVGRLDDVINRGGEKVYPREIEEVLLQDPEVEATAVVGRPHPTVGEEPVAFVLAVSACSDRDALAERLSARCRRQLSRFKWPAMVTVADVLPAGPTGKIRRTELRRSLAVEPA